jgi:hypothetical protein
MYIHPGHDFWSWYVCTIVVYIVSALLLYRSAEVTIGIGGGFESDRLLFFALACFLAFLLVLPIMLDIEI